MFLSSNKLPSPLLRLFAQWPFVWKTLSARLPQGVLLIFLLLLLDALAALTWRFLAEEGDLAVHAPSVTRNKATIPSAAPQLQQVAEWHLFGKAVDGVAASRAVMTAPETRLKLTLKGVFASTDQQRALAIIAANKGQEKRYHVGDDIRSGVKLHAIYADRVILQRNGKLETLRLPKPVLKQALVYQPSASQHAAGGGATAQQKLRALRQTLLTEPARIWQEVRISPVMKQGHIEGYRLQHNDRALMRSLNLRESDIITHINGKPLSEPSTLYGLMRELASGEALAVTLQRDGQQMQLELRF